MAVCSAIAGFGSSSFSSLQRQIDSATNSLEHKGDTINAGLCDGFYAMNTTLLNGFAGVNQNMNSGFQTAELSRANQQAALMQQLNAMQMQAQECCCEDRAAIAQVRYDMATQACDTRNTIQTATRDIVENANANSRAILDFLTQSKLRELESANQELRMAASQAVQNNYLISQLRPTPSPVTQAAIRGLTVTGMPVFAALTVAAIPTPAGAAITSEGIIAALMAWNT